MTRYPQTLFTFPGQAQLGRVVPKNKIYQHVQLGSARREKFVSQVEKIFWAYKLAPETINLPARVEVPEIQIFDIEIKGAELDDEVLRAIDEAVPYPIIFQLRRERQIRMVASYKRPSQAEAGKWVVDDYLTGSWLPDDIERQPLPMALDLHGLYEQLLRSLLPQPSRAGESLSDQLARLGRLRSRQGEYRKLEARLRKEKQFNRKVALNAQLRDLENEISLLGP